MYLYFDRTGTLKEQITVPARVGNSGINKIYVYWDSDYAFTSADNDTTTEAWCRYKKADDTYTVNLWNDAVVKATIPYDQNRDLKFFKYGQTYKFYVFNIPDEVLTTFNQEKVQSVLFSCWFEINGSVEHEEDGDIVTMSLVAFAVEPSTQSVAEDQNINIAQWNALVKMLSGTTDFTNIDVKKITFKNSDPAADDGLSVKNNVIYWKGNEIALIKDVVTLTGHQTVGGNKDFTGTTVIRDLILRLAGNVNKAIGIYKFGEGHDDNYTINVKDPDTGGSFAIYLPQASGDLALTDDIGDATITIQKNGVDVDTFKVNAKTDKAINITVPTSNDYVATSGDQGINGNKTFWDQINIRVEDNNKTIMYLEYSDTDTEKIQSYLINSPEPADNEWELTLPDDNGTLALTKNIENALKPSILDPAVSAANDYVSKSGGSVTIAAETSYTVPVEAGYQIVATFEHGSTITDIDQETGEISFSGATGDTLYWHYNAVNFRFNIGSDYNGLYVFTHSYLTMLIPVYNLTDGKTYKFTGPGLQNAQGSVLNLVHNMKRSGQYLTIWSGNTDYPFIAGRTGILAKVKLY